jgi:hypothetical protein
MNTKELIDKLRNIKSKNDFIGLIKNELNQIINHFNQKGYNVDIQKGFVGRQVLQDDNDLFDYQYFRDVHFLYWGLNGDWNTFDSIDKIYYDKLKDIIESLYDKID